MKIISFFVVICSLLIILGCDKEIKKEIEKSSDKIDVKAYSNMLAFDSQKDFDMAVEVIKMDGKINYPETFKSLNSVLASQDYAYVTSKIGNNEGEEYELGENPLIESEVLSRLLNENREVLVDGVIYRINEYGTFFAPVESYQNLITCATNFNGSDYAQTGVDGYYSNTIYPDVNIFDTFSHTELPVGEKPWRPEEGPPQTITEYPDPGTPNDPTVNWKIVDDGKTWVGKLLQSIFGFSKVEHHNFSDYKRTRVKFYSLDFVIYAEAGVKTKYQEKDWFWTKQYSSQLVSGFKHLVFEEKWPADMFPAYFKPSDYNLSYTTLSVGSFHYLGAGDNQFRDNSSVKKTLFTVDIMGYSLDVTNKDVQNAIYNALKQAGRFANKNKHEIAIRVFTLDNRTRSYIIAFDQHVTLSGDVNTYIIASHFGFRLSYTTNLSGGGFEWKNFKVQNAVPDLKYNKGTILYGSAKYSNIINGIQMEFK